MGNTVWQEKGTEKWLKGKKEQGSANQEKRIFKAPLMKRGSDFHTSSFPQNKCSLVFQHLNSLHLNSSPLQQNTFFASKISMEKEWLFL